MAKTVKSPAAPTFKTFEPDRRYRVKLARVVRRPGLILRPGDDDVVLKGKLCTELGDAIASAVEA